MEPQACWICGRAKDFLRNELCLDCLAGRFQVGMWAVRIITPGETTHESIDASALRISEVSKDGEEIRFDGFNDWVPARRFMVARYQ